MRKVDVHTLRKWKHYAAHAKKFRTRKKYKRKLSEHLRGLLSWYAPASIETPIVTARFRGWWERTPYCDENGFLYSETQIAGMWMAEKRRNET